MALIDVAIPVHNAQDFVEGAVRSVLLQEDFGGELRVVLADDCSTDQTWAVCQTLAENDRRITLLRNEKNLGIAATLNRCLAASQAKYFARMDADDIALPRRFAIQLDFMRTNNLSLCGGEMTLIGAASGRMRCSSNADDYAATLLFRPPFGHPTAMMDRERMAAKGLRYGTDAAHLHAEDYGLWIDFSLAGEPAACMTTPLVQYRVLEESISRTQSRKQLENALGLSVDSWEKRGLKAPASAISTLRNAIVNPQPARKAARDLIDALAAVRTTLDPYVGRSAWARSEFASFCTRFFVASTEMPDRLAMLRTLARLDAVGCWTYHWRRKLLSDRL